MFLELRHLEVPPGQRLLLHDLSWQAFETILDELGDRRACRLAYDDRTLEIVMPLPEHEANKEIIGDLVKALLEEREIEFWSLGSTTFKDKLLGKGLEPDQCFYIRNEAKIRNKQRIDLSVDPPPDLALEIDITSRTHPNIYAALGVPELWRFDRNLLQINILVNGAYIEVPESPTLPGIDLVKVIPKYLEQSKARGRNATLRLFRRWINEQG